MHQDLSPHLHTEECNTIIEAHKKCQKDHPWGRIVGFCDRLDTAMSNCLRNERQEKLKERSKVVFEPQMNMLKDS